MVSEYNLCNAMQPNSRYTLDDRHNNTCKKKLANVRETLLNMYWNFPPDDLAFAFHDCQIKLTDAFNVTCPISLLKQNSKTQKINPWMTNELLKSHIQKQKLFVKFLFGK